MAFYSAMVPSLLPPTVTLIGPVIRKAIAPLPALVSSSDPAPCRAHDMLWVRYFPRLVGLGPEMVAACLHE
jgi:hypothetical protein